MATKDGPDIQALFVQALETEPGIDIQDFAKRFGLAPKAVRAALPAGITEERNNRLSRMLAAEIETCAKELEVSIADLQGSRFTAWLKESGGPLKPYHLAMVGGFARVRDAHHPALKPTVQQVEKYALGRYAAHNRKFSSVLAEQQLFLDEMAKHAACWENKAKVLKEPPKAKDIRRTVITVLSDLHYGADVDARQTGYLGFGPTEEARCTAKMAKQVGDYKSEYRDQTDLVVILGGDIIENHLHYVRDAADIAEQCSRASHALLYFFQYVASKYAKVTVYAVSGNHDRNKWLQEKRADSGKVGNSFATIIYDNLARALKPLKNVSFFIPQTAWVIFEAQGNKYYATHGDTNLDPGSPGSSINVKGMENQTNQIMATFGKIDCFIAGHVHVSTNVELTNGSILLTNGTMTPVGGFAVSHNIHRAPNSQWIFEATEGYPVGDARRINFDRKTHEDESLDVLVPTWTAYGS